MAFLARYRKAELIELANELDIKVEDTDKIKDLCSKIKDIPEFDEEFCKNLLVNIVDERERADRKEREELERADRKEREDREFELEKLRLANTAETISTASSQSEVVCRKPKIKSVMQPFDPEKSDISIYFTMFERQARALDIDKADYVTQLISVLPFDLGEIIMREPEEKAQNYDHVKQVLLDRFLMRPETFRMKFVQHQRRPNSLWKELVFELRNYLEGWLKGTDTLDYEKLKNLMLSDQIKRRAPPEIKDHFIDQWSKLNDPSVLAEKLDEYESVRRKTGKQTFVKLAEKRAPEKNTSAPPNKENREKNGEKNKGDFWKSRAPSDNWRQKQYEKRAQPACYICKSLTHLRPNCPELRKDYPVEKVNHIETPGSIEEIFSPYVSRALVNKNELPVLRDTGSTIDIVCRNYIKPHDLTGETVWIKTPLNHAFTCLPLAKIELESSEFGKITTKAAILDSSLDNGLYILGNGSAQLIEKQKKCPNFNAVMTRSQARISNEIEESAPPVESKTTSLDENISFSESAEPEADENFGLPPPGEQVSALLDVSPEGLGEEQKNCASLSSCWDKQRKGHKEFAERENLLFRQNKNHQGEINLQLVIPEKYRRKILELCHEGASAHLGMTKTKDRLLKYYFWPNCFKEIEEYVRSCDPCQRVGKPQDKKKAPLKLVPIITEIFSKVNIDAVGPLPVSKTNKRYLITAICMSSKYPEAIPVHDITSVSVIDALLIIFSRFGYPREIQCDLGRSFTSQLTTEFFNKFGIKITHSSLFRPESNVVERFHRSVKRLIKVLCIESGDDWEKTLPAALLALRTVTHESTGFSPAELVHGRNLRMPETLLYEHWVTPQETDVAVTEYVFDLINRLKKCQELSFERMTEAQKKRKLWFDKNAVKRKFQAGDLVLVLATSRPNKMSVEWIGPGTVEKQISETNYIVKLPHRREQAQIYHVNLMKPYNKRPESVNLMLSEEVSSPVLEDELEIVYPNADPNEYDFEEITRESELNDRLSPEEIKELKTVLDSHSQMFSNNPGKTNLVEHDIELISNNPIRSKPYRTSKRQTEILKTEIKRMLDLNIIEIGQSDYTSPMILVETPGKDPRPCIDYRRLNSITRTEFFPLPKIEERVELVSAAKFITVIDLAKGYWQIPLTKRAQRYAAFVTSFGTYIPLRMCFGLLNAPFEFSRLMSQILTSCEEFAVPYLDDVAIFSSDWQSHLHHLNIVLKKIADANLTIKPSKCKFAQFHTKYLGHIVGGGIRSPAEAKIKAVLDFPTPTTSTQIKAFMGLAGYYAHYIDKFSVIAAPLTDALKGKAKREQINWTPECERAFTTLKRKLTSNPVLHAPDYNKPFIVQTDASDRGIGIVLSQRDSEKRDYPILYLSKKFSKSEQNYSTTEKECASIIYAVKKLHYYLDGQSFIIETDHNPLVWLKNNSGKNPRLLRWALLLQAFSYEISHRSGAKNQNADALSRIEN